MCKCNKHKQTIRQVSNRYFQDASKFGFLIENRAYLAMLDKITDTPNYMFHVKTEEQGNFGYRYNLSVDNQSFISERFIYNAILPLRLQDKINKSYPFE